MKKTSKIELAGIEIREFRLTVPETYTGDSFEYDNEFRVEYKKDFDENKIGAFVSVQTLVKEITGLEGYVKALLIFSTTKEIMGEGNDMPKALMHKLNKIVFGTIRGLMAAQYRGTVFNGVYLSLIPGLDIDDEE